MQGITVDTHRSSLFQTYNFHLLLVDEILVVLTQCLQIAENHRIYIILRLIEHQVCFQLLWIVSCIVDVVSVLRQDATNLLLLFLLQ